jgi:hypothetical protein
MTWTAAYSSCYCELRGFHNDIDVGSRLPCSKLFRNVGNNQSTRRQIPEDFNVGTAHQIRHCYQIMDDVTYDMQETEEEKRNLNDRDHLADVRR